MTKKPTKAKLECKVKNCKHSHKARPIKWKELAGMSLYELVKERNSRTQMLVPLCLIDVDGKVRLLPNLDDSIYGSVLPIKTESEMRQWIIGDIISIEEDRKYGWEHA